MPTRHPSCLAHIRALESAPVSPTSLNAHVHTLMSFHRSRSMREMITTRSGRRVGVTASTSSTRVSAGRATLEIPEVLKTRRSTWASRAHVCRQASARPAYGSLGASILLLLPPPLRAHPPWLLMATGGATQLKPERFEQRQRAPMRSHLTGWSLGSCACQGRAGEHKICDIVARWGPSEW
jgi:hypothetical protein